MLRILGTAFLAFAAASAVSGHVIRHRGPPKGWETGILQVHSPLVLYTLIIFLIFPLQNYTLYHQRYLQYGCETKHNTTFFDNCCHPLLVRFRVGICSIVRLLTYHPRKVNLSTSSRLKGAPPLLRTPLREMTAMTATPRSLRFLLHNLYLHLHLRLHLHTRPLLSKPTLLMSSLSNPLLLHPLPPNQLTPNQLTPLQVLITR